MRLRHIGRLQRGECSIDAGFIWSDLLTDLERVADHCSNIAGCVIDTHEQNMNLHESLRAMKSDSPTFKQLYKEYAAEYLNPAK